MVFDTIPQIQIDEILVGYSRLLRHLLEVLDNVNTQTHGNLLLEAIRVGILPPLHLREVVLLPHFPPPAYVLVSFFVAFRAEIILITDSLLR